MGIFINVAEFNDFDEIDYTLSLHKHVMEVFNSDEILLEAFDPKEILKNIRTGITTFFKHVYNLILGYIKFIQSYFIAGKNFADKFGKYIIEKDDDGFIYYTKDYDIVSGNKKYISLINELTILKKEISNDMKDNHFISHDTVRHYMYELTKRLGHPFMDMDIMSGHTSGVLTEDEVLKYIKKAYIGITKDSSYVQPYKGFNKQVRVDMLTHLRKFSDNLKILADLKSEFLDDEKTLLNELQKFESENALEHNDPEFIKFKIKSTMFKKITSMMIGATSISILAYKEAFTEYMRILREFMKYNIHVKKVNDVLAGKSEKKSEEAT